MANAWKIARKSNAQLPLVIVIALAVVLVLLGKAQSGLFDRARAGVTDCDGARCSRRCTRRSRLSTAGSARSPRFSRVYEQNLKLKEENARLRQWRNVAIVLQGRVGRYQALLHAVPDPKMNAVLARVIGRANRPFLQTMILDAGRDQHALPGQAVMDARGMIGRIYLSRPAHQLGDPAHRPQQPHSRHHRVVRQGRHIPGDHDRRQQQAAGAGHGLAHRRPCMPGDQVTSSGDGGLLPAGPAHRHGGRRRRGGWRVALLADAAASQDVEVLNFSKPPEALPADGAVAGARPPASSPSRRRRPRRHTAPPAQRRRCPQARSQAAPPQAAPAPAAGTPPDAEDLDR